MCLIINGFSYDFATRSKEATRGLLALLLGTRSYILVTSALLLGARASLLVTKGITTRSILATRNY